VTAVRPDRHCCWQMSCHCPCWMQQHLGRVCGSVGGVLRGAGMGGGREAKGGHNSAALQSMLPQAIKI